MNLVRNLHLAANAVIVHSNPVATDHLDKNASLVIGKAEITMATSVNSAVTLIAMATRLAKDLAGTLPHAANVATVPSRLVAKEVMPLEATVLLRQEAIGPKETLHLVVREVIVHSRHAVNEAMLPEAIGPKETSHLAVKVVIVLLPLEVNPVVTDHLRPEANLVVTNLLVPRSPSVLLSVVLVNQLAASLSSRKPVGRRQNLRLVANALAIDNLGT